MSVIYNLKYALTKGIIVSDGELLNDGTAARVKNNKFSWMDYLFKGQFTTSRDEAITKANAMREARIASLRKQIKRLESLEIKFL